MRLDNLSSIELCTLLPQIKSSLCTVDSRVNRRCEHAAGKAGTMCRAAAGAAVLPARPRVQMFGGEPVSTRRAARQHDHEPREHEHVRSGRVLSALCDSTNNNSPINSPCDNGDLRSIGDRSVRGGACICEPVTQRTRFDLPTPASVTPTPLQSRRGAGLPLGARNLRAVREAGIVTQTKSPTGALRAPGLTLP